MKVQAAPLRVGILGCSDIARRKFVPALRESTLAELVAVASRQPVKGAGIAPEGQEILGYGELLARPDVDLVYISLPNHLHEEWTIRALEEGKHVICEKPLGLSPASVDRMLATAVERAYTTPAGMTNRVQLTCGGEDLSFDVPPADHFRLMIDQVCGLVRDGGDFREAHERARRVARLADLMQKGCSDGN